MKNAHLSHTLQLIATGKARLFVGGEDRRRDEFREGEGELDLLEEEFNKDGMSSAEGWGVTLGVGGAELSSWFVHNGIECDEWVEQKIWPQRLKYVNVTMWKDKERIKAEKVLSAVISLEAMYIDSLVERFTKLWLTGNDVFLLLIQTL